MKDALVWTRQGVTRAAQCMSCMIEQAEIKARQEGRPCIHLYDGSPRNLPAHTRVLCCTRALERWDNLIASDQRHAALYMAPRDISDLLGACAKLKLEAFPNPVSREDFSNRYGKLGGVARVCLSQRKQYPSQVETRIKEAIGKIPTGAELNKALVGEYSSAELTRRLHHRVPVPGSPHLFTLELSSPYVEKLLMCKGAEFGPCVLVDAELATRGFEFLQSSVFGT